MRSGRGPGTKAGRPAARERREGSAPPPPGPVPGGPGPAAVAAAAGRAPAFPSFRPPARLLSSPLAPGDRVRENCPLAAPIPAPGPRARRSLARRARDIDKPRPFVATPRAATPPAPFRTPTHTRGPGAVADARGKEPGLPGRAGEGGAPPCKWPADQGWDGANPPESKPPLAFREAREPHAREEAPRGTPRDLRGGDDVGRASSDPRGSIYLSIYLSSWFRKLRPLRWLGWVVLAYLPGIRGPRSPECFFFFLSEDPQK